MDLILSEIMAARLLKTVDDVLQFIQLTKPSWPEGGYVKQLLHPIARILLIAAYDDDHIFSKLRGTRFIIKAIWEYALPFYDEDTVREHIQRSYESNIFALKKCPVQFPAPEGFNINMMPFIHSLDFEKTKLPECLRGYFNALILPSLGKTGSDYCKINYCQSSKTPSIYYLTIQESWVGAGRSQRRPGLHIESPGDTEGEVVVMRDHFRTWDSCHDRRC